ncbi:UDP-glucose 4-epimerase [Brevundimonas sp. 374]|nr:UDP-glucose 4-epimerase [Brevundimonas sp. 374]
MLGGRNDESLNLILVIGGSGFIGQHFRDFARGRCDVVYVLRSGAQEQLEANTGETFIDADSFEGAVGDQIIQQASAILYLRSASVPGTFEANPDGELDFNATPALRFFTRCARLNLDARVIFTSSGGAVYGARQQAPITEAQPTLPISAYGYGKMIIEDGLRLLSRSRGQRFSILRLSNPVGRYHTNPRQGLVPAAFHAVRTAQSLPLFGTSNVRDYVDADDVAAALMAAACDVSSECRTLNIGSGKGLSIAQMIKLIETTLSLTVPVKIEPARQVDVPYVILDCSNAERQLGWRASTPISQTLLKTWLGPKSN